MADASPFVSPFTIFEVASFQKPLATTLSVVGACQEESERRSRVFKLAGLGLVLELPITASWLVIMGYLRYTTGSFLFVSNWLGGGFSCLLLTALCCGGLAWLASEDGRKSVPSGLKMAIAGGLLLVTFIMLLPFVPITWLAVVAIFALYLGSESQRLHTDKSVVSGGPSYFRRDNRYQDYLLLAQHVATWNRLAELLNRLILKLEHNQFEPGDAARVRQHLETLRPEEDFVRSRVQYCEALAEQGEFGSKVTSMAFGAELVHDSSNRLDDLRRHLEDLQELDRRTVAALEVAAVGRR